MAKWVVDPDKGLRATIPECPFCTAQLVLDLNKYLCPITVERMNHTFEQCVAIATLYCPGCGRLMCEECATGKWKGR